MTVDWHGVFPAATTQFHADHSLNIPGTLEHIEAMIQAGIHGLVILGTVGENCSLEYLWRWRATGSEFARSTVGTCLCCTWIRTSNWCNTSSWLPLSAALAPK